MTVTTNAATMIAMTMYKPVNIQSGGSGQSSGSGNTAYGSKVGCGEEHSSPMQSFTAGPASPG